MQKQIKKIYGKNTPRELLERMTDEEFNIKYNTLLSIVKNKKIAYKRLIFSYR